MSLVSLACARPGGPAPCGDHRQSVGQDRPERLWINRLRCGQEDQGLRSRERSPERHILTDAPGLLLKADVHSAGIQDRGGAARLSDKLTARFPFLEVIIGDGGYAGNSSSLPPNATAPCLDSTEEPIFLNGLLSSTYSKDQ